MTRQQRVCQEDNEDMAYQGVLPRMGVMGVLVQEVVVRLLEIVVAISKHEAGASVIQVTICTICQSGA